MVSNNGIGGGDIKLAALLGILYGPHGVLFILAARIITHWPFQALGRLFSQYENGTLFRLLLLSGKHNSGILFTLLLTGFTIEQLKRRTRT